MRFAATTIGADTAVGRVRAPLDEPGVLQLVEQVGHDGAVDAELLCQRELAARLAPSGGAEHLVAAGPAGQPADDLPGRVQVRPRDVATAA